MSTYSSQVFKSHFTPELLILNRKSSINATTTNTSHLDTSTAREFSDDHSTIYISLSWNHSSMTSWNA